MAQHVVVVEKEHDFAENGTGCRVVTARDFIRQPPPGATRGWRVINLCHDYQYLGLGYYCSLLAEARGLKVMPSTEVMLELHWKRLYRDALAVLQETLVKDVARTAPPATDLTLNVYFGRPDNPHFETLARRTFDAFRCPILALELTAAPTWQIRSVQPVSVRTLSPEQRSAFELALDGHTRRRWRPRKSPTPAKYSLAVLHDPKEEFPPSDPGFLKRLQSAGESLDIEVELITRGDLGRLLEFDALFIRETTSIDHHTYRFAKKAEAEGLPVIDDPMSILRCSNKVYLAEKFNQLGIPTPRTMLLDRSRLLEVEQRLSYPMVLKIPDGSFSRGVFKAAERGELETIAGKMFSASDIILAQEFMYTEFDWRIGVLNRRPLFVCQYKMSPRHWQILKHEPDGSVREGQHITLDPQEVPADVVATGLRAAGAIGDGLYGVDVKQTPHGVFVIEVNDNPNIWAGVEDLHAKGNLYRTLLQDFVRRIEARTGGPATR